MLVSFFLSFRSGIKSIPVCLYERVWVLNKRNGFNTFCRTFLRLWYSDYLYESHKSVTLDWYARAYSIKTLFFIKNKARERKQKILLTEREILRQNFIWIWFASVHVIFSLHFLCNFPPFISLYAKAIKKTTNALPYSSKKETEQNSMNTANKMKAKTRENEI